MTDITLRNILIILTGGSPQVVTETLYGMHTRGLPMPDEIKIITTAFGKQRASQAGLMGDAGKIAAFCRDYSLAPIHVDDDDVWIIEDNDGAPMDDARTVHQHNAMADFIIDKVRQITRARSCTSFYSLSASDSLKGAEKKELRESLRAQHQSMPGFRDIILQKSRASGQWQFAIEHDTYAVHASVAGGRKSMTFLLGYAMSLFGRSQDKVSHVLIDERVEHPALPFFYPAPDGSFSFTDENNRPQRFDNIDVALAELPLVRMSEQMPSVILDAHRSYSETVAIFESIRHSEPHLELYAAFNSDSPLRDKPYLVTCSGFEAWLDAEAFAYLWAWSELEIPVEKDDSETLALAIASRYAFLKTGAHHNFSDLLEAAAAFAGPLSDYDPKFDYIFGQVKESDLETIIENGEITRLGGVLGIKYDKYRNTLKTKLAEQVGGALASMYTPALTGKTEDGASLYELPLPTEAVQVYLNDKTAI